MNIELVASLAFLSNQAINPFITNRSSASVQDLNQAVHGEIITVVTIKLIIAPLINGV